MSHTTFLMRVFSPSSLYGLPFYGYSLPLTNPFLSKTPGFALRLNVLLVILAISLLLPLIFRRNIKDKNGHPIPPGPLFRYAAIRPYPERILHDWSKSYGPLFSLWMGDQLFVVISDARIAKDLLVSNGAIFSSRKPYFMKSQMILRGLGITSTPYNDTW
jgi:Cytochrome P450